MQLYSKETFADSLRGIACLSVVIAHYGSFWIPAGTVIPLIANVSPLPADITPPFLYSATIYWPSFSPAEFGVALFFLISGFVIPLSLDRLEAFSFLRARCWRLAPTYTVGFLFTLAALALASKVYGKPFPYGPGEMLIHAVPGPRFLFGGPWIDYVIWTLEVEICFYLLCTVVAQRLRDGSILVFAIPLSLAAISLSILDGIYATYAQAVAFMFIGTAFNFHRRKRIDTLALLGIVAMLCVVSISAAGRTQGRIIMVSLEAATVLFTAAYAARNLIPDLWVLRSLAAISYPLYVVHGIMGYVAMRIMVDHGISPTVAIVLALSLALTVSTAIHFLVEKPTQKYGKAQSPKTKLQAAE